jgi:hypothetical protein
MVEETLSGSEVDGVPDWAKRIERPEDAMAKRQEVTDDL